MRPLPIVDHNGQPFAVNFKAASTTSRELACWRPPLVSSDQEISEKPEMEGRAHDLARNNGYVAGAETAHRDTIVGPSYRLSLRPNAAALGIDEDALSEWAELVENEFMLYADCPDAWIDAQRRMTFSQFMRVFVSYDFLSGEHMFTREWRDDRRSKYSTCFKIIEPERVSNPQSVVLNKPGRQQDKIHEGVEVDRFGAPMAYHLRFRHPSEFTLSNGLKTHQRIKRYDSFGQMQFFHIFEALRANQRRGLSRVNAAIHRAKMLDNFEQVELEMAILGATYGMVVTSDFGANSIYDAMRGDNDITDAYGTFLGAKSEWGKETDLNFNGTKIPHLFPGEKIEQLKSEHPNNSFAAFEAAMLRPMSKALNRSYEQLTGDYTHTNNSSAKAAMTESWRFVTAKRSNTVNKSGSFIFRAWLDEAINTRKVPMPKGLKVSDYFSVRDALSKCTWIGAGKGNTDELKDSKANEIKLRTGETNLRKIAAENGDDWKDNIMQSAKEAAARIAALEVNGIEVTEEMKMNIINNSGVGDQLMFGAE